MILIKNSLMHKSSFFIVGNSKFFCFFYIKFYFKCEKCLRILQPVIIKNKESLQKMALEMYQNFPIEKKKNSSNMVGKDIKFFLKMKRKG